MIVSHIKTGFLISLSIGVLLGLGIALDGAKGFLAALVLIIVGTVRQQATKPCSINTKH